MSFPKYPKYKDSGEEWLGDVPEHWHVKPLKHVATLKSGGTPNKETFDYWNGDIPWASSKDLKSEWLSDTQDHIASKALYDGMAELVPASSVLVVVRGMILLHSFPVARITREMAINQDLKALVAKPTISTAFLAWLLRGSTEETLGLVDEAAHGTKVLRMDRWTAMYLPIPPIVEQAAIAAFLDRETAKIDALVAEQQRLIELLKEKRQAVISHAVTKGLNPAAPMKDSGIEWLGQVPEHWDVWPLKRCWEITDCKHITAEFVDDGGYPLASIREVQSKWVDLDSAKRTTDQFYEQLIEGGRKPMPGDLIFSRNATVGEVAQVGEQHPPFAMGQDVCLLRRKEPDYSTDYLQHVIRSPLVIEQLANMMIGSTFKRINVEEIRSIVITSPPAKEQQLIVRFLDPKLNQFDALTASAESASSLLQERRTALISAAVTGKIDVRGLVETEAA